MEYKMRRFKQMLPNEDIKQILLSQTNGVLSLIDPDGEPYGVPLSFAYDGDTSIYFHSALAGRKIDAIAANHQGSFCVIQQDVIVPEEFTTYFRSVIVKGEIEVMRDRDDILKGLKLLCEKYSAGVNSDEEISRCIDHVCVFKLSILSMSGKEAIELVRQRMEK
ncbi:MAG: pyridoxamine 5'-phosphate oxidase family protein [Bacteroides sp.]|nr:pyridoxamine 5'-phosphate oxidase family protein [Bacteroides sp.]